MKTPSLLFAFLPALGLAQLTVSPEVTDFGKVAQGERPSSVVTVTNPTEHPIVIRDIIRTCSCADLTVEKRTLAPGESTKATFILDSNVFDGPFQKTFFLRTEGGPSAAATVKGDIRSFDGHPPQARHLGRRDGSQGQNRRSRLHHRLPPARRHDHHPCRLRHLPRHPPTSLHSKRTPRLVENTEDLRLHHSRPRHRKPLPEE